MRNTSPINHFPPTLFSPNRSPIYERRNYISQPGQPERCPEPPWASSCASPRVEARKRLIHGYGVLRRRSYTTAFSVDDPSVWYPRIGPPPFCPATVLPWAGLHNPFRITRGVACQRRDMRLIIKKSSAQPQGAQGGKAATELKTALTQRRRGRGATLRRRAFSFSFLCVPQRISAALR